MSLDGALNGLLKLAIAVAVVGGGALGVIAVLDRMAHDRQAAERRALVQRNAELSLSAVAPGSTLACLDGGAGEAVENACEKQVFADPQRAAAAVAYMAARLSLLADAAAAQPPALEAFAATRRAVELDRYGVAAHVLSVRDGCTAEHCPAFVWLGDTAALRANLKAQIFDQYVSRYAASWAKDGAKEPEKPAPVAAAAPPAAVAAVTEAPAGRPVSDKYDFPSAASIPPVSIMNAEPPLPKAAAEAQAQAAQPKSEKSEKSEKPEAAPKRPQAQATSPQAR